MQHILTALFLFFFFFFSELPNHFTLWSWAHSKAKGYGIILNLLSKAAEDKHDICQNVSVEFDRMYSSLCKRCLSDLLFILIAKSGWTCLAELLRQVDVKRSKSHPNVKTCKTLNCDLQLFLQHKKFLNLLSEMASPLCLCCHASLLPVILQLLVDWVFVSTNI